MKEDVFPKLSASTVAFISCRDRQTQVLAGAARGETGSKSGGGRVRLSVLIPENWQDFKMS